MVEIPTEFLLGGVIAILSALFALTYKNNRCIARIEENIKGINSHITEHKAETKNAFDRLSSVEKDIIRLGGD